MLRLLLLALRHRGLRAAGAVVAAFVGGMLLAWRIRRLSQRREETREASRRRMSQWLDAAKRGETRASIAQARRAAVDAAATADEAKMELDRARALRAEREGEVARLVLPLNELERAAGVRK